MVYGALAADDKELAMLTRSILDILIDLSSFITVPEAHVQERRVGPTAEPEAGPGGPIPPLVRDLQWPREAGRCLRGGALPEPLALDRRP